MCLARLDRLLHLQIKADVIAVWRHRPPRKDLFLVCAVAGTGNVGRPCAAQRNTRLVQKIMKVTHVCGPVPRGVGICDIARDNSQTASRMGSKRLRQSRQFQFLEHRGFSLDWLHHFLGVIPLESVRVEQRVNIMSDVFSPLRARVDMVRLSAPIGRVTAISGSVVQVAGLDRCCAIGDLVQIGPVAGEIIAMSGGQQTVLPESGLAGLSLGAEVRHCGAFGIAPDMTWLGRIVDPRGRPLDGRPLFPGRVQRRLEAPPPPAVCRRRMGERLSTGKIAFDTLLPIVRGQRMGLFAGSGVGKSSLLGSFARHVPADVVIVALVGERGREVRGFAENVLGKKGLARSVIMAATSDQSPLLRRRCALAAMTLAEHFRDQGLHVLLLVDSVTRFAEAHREIALAAGESASLRGYPPSLQQAIMAMAERAGPGADGQGDITAIFSVLVAGSDMDEPVADILRGVLDGHAVLDRRIAERGRFPALDVLRSVSRSLPEAATADENRLIADARDLLGIWDRVEMMVQAGLYQKGADPVVDRALRIWPLLDRLIGDDAPGGIAQSFQQLQACLAGQSQPH